MKINIYECDYMKGGQEVLDLQKDAVELLVDLINIPSVSKNEEQIATHVYEALQPCTHLEVTRHNNTIVARTQYGLPSRVIIAGHLDTVPEASNLEAKIEGNKLYGLGSVDMKGGIAIALRLAALTETPKHDVTYLFYECEEIDSVFNGLKKLLEASPEMMEGDFAILMEPTEGVVEAGCQGSMKLNVFISGKRAHTARWWTGTNAIHATQDVLERLNKYEPRIPIVDGIEYIEGLQAVDIRGGVAGNVVPDEVIIKISHRIAPDRSSKEAFAHLCEVFDGYKVELVDQAEPARPGVDNEIVKAFIADVETTVRAKLGWTDVSRFSSIGIPAINFGPGDPRLAHSPNEHVLIDNVRFVDEKMHHWLYG